MRRRRLVKRISYSVHLKDIASNVLFFAGEPEFLRIDAPRVLRSASGNYKFIYREPGTVAYEVYSSLITVDGQNETDPESFLPFDNRNEYLRLPDIDPRIVLLARSITVQQNSGLKQARAIESSFVRISVTRSICPRRNRLIRSRIFCSSGARATANISLLRWP